MRRTFILLVACACALAQPVVTPEGCPQIEAMECAAVRGRMLSSCACRLPFSRLGSKVLGYVGLLLVGLFWLS